KHRRARLMARHPVVSRLPTYWRDYRSSRLEVAGAAAGKAELRASSHWALPGQSTTVLVTVRYPFDGTGTNEDISEVVCDGAVRRFAPGQAQGGDHLGRPGGHRAGRRAGARRSRRGGGRGQF